MAQGRPAKRPRALTDHQSSAHGTAGSKDRSKRPRLSTEQSSERDDSEEIESSDSEQDPDEGEDEAAYVRATQIVQKSLRKTADQQNVPAEAGIIEEIRCTNFMCHEQLTVPLGPLINFIIGHNGSGKSAVLTALTLCLAGKATATNRGQNLKSFIKEGKDSFTLSVKIKNQGPTAYKPDQYGDSIIVERYCKQSGPSGFKLKDQNGKTVSTKKADVEDIIDAFALQIDNPMNVLTQDMARQFLIGQNSKDKYNFFLKGTQLETLSRDYAQIARELDEQQAKAQTLKGDVGVYRSQLEDAVKKARLATNLEVMRAKEVTLAHQAAWAQVEGEERELDVIDAELERVDREIEARKNEADDQSELFSRADQALENAQTEIQECQAEKQPAEQEVAECRSQFDEVKQALLNLKGDERNIMQSVMSHKKTVVDTESQIQDHRQRQAEADNGLYAQKLQELDEAKALCERERLAWESHDASLAELTEQLSAARDQRKRADGKLHQKQDEERRSRSKIRDLEQGQRKWVDSYPTPANLEKLFRAIQTERRFRERPVGPMGRHVELKNPEWGFILEKSFGPALNGFVVTSKADQGILSELMRRFNYHAPVFIGRNEPINTAPNEPDRELLTWMRVLQINNDLVRNQLIINQSIDQVVLIPRRADAQEFMYRPSADRKNVRICFTMADGNRRKGHTYTVNQASGAVNLGPIDEYKGSFRMEADKGPQIQYEKDNLRAIQQEILNLEAGVRAAQEHLDACQRKIQDHNKEKQHLKVQFQHAQDDMERLENELSAATPDAAMIEQLERELAEAQQQLREDENQLEDLYVNHAQRNEEARVRKKRLDEADRSLADLVAKLDKLSTKVQTLTQRRERALKGKNDALQKVQDAANIRNEWEQRRAQQQEQLESYREQASTICPRVDVPQHETFDTLKQKLDRLIKEREESEKQLGGSEEELLREANEAKRRWKEAKNELTAIENVRNYMTSSLENRKVRWLRFRQEITMRARVTFNYLLSERQYRGSLNVDHTNQRLDLQIQPDITVASNAGRQPKTLSGGEKSFSTVCLLLALWDAMGSPIRCLDEFDVFMDAANRKIAMELLSESARRAVGRQHIFITPQSMDSTKVHSMHDVKIIRMADPDRDQTALNFGN